MEALPLLRTWGRMRAAELQQRMGVSRATLMRAVRAQADRIIVRGSARRTAYAARRTMRGSDAAIALFRIDEQGRGSQLGVLEPVYPNGAALALSGTLEWPLPGDMADGWFDGLPYPLDDMRPQGFIGRNFARRHAALLQVGVDPGRWSEDDVLHALSLLGSDMPGNYILGEAAYRQHLDTLYAPPAFLEDDEGTIGEAYLGMASDALQGGVAGSSAGGEFPKFTARRMLDGEKRHVLVKFSGDDASAGTQRWADLLVCEHLALSTIARELGIAAAQGRIYQRGGRTMLEVLRFDRHGEYGRSAVCSWLAINTALLDVADASWIAGGAALLRLKLITQACADDIARVWHFGQLIANTDMHEGNLSFRPGLSLAPVYDMLPMAYAPVRGSRTATAALCAAAAAAGRKPGLAAGRARGHRVLGQRRRGPAHQRVVSRHLRGECAIAAGTP
ncbi:MAG: type II toxin-antitoxin system HipA family toxin YjjJ [Noviherbaspirillum sp.]